MQVETAVLPAGTRVPSLEEMQSTDVREAFRGLASRTEIGQSRVAQETVGPARSYAPLAEERSRIPPLPSVEVRAFGRAEPKKIIYPEPSRTMSEAECRKGLGETRPFFFKSRFSACSGAVFVQTWIKNNRPVGQSQFVALAVGTIPKNSRKINYKYHFTDMEKTGDAKTSGLKITIDPKHPKTWPSKVKIKQGGNVPKSPTFDVLKSLKTFPHTATVNAGQGSKPDDRVFGVYEPVITLTPPAGYKLGGDLTGKLFMLPPRWDAASYLPNAKGTTGKPATKGSAAFSYIGFLKYSTKAGSPEKAVSDHIEKAFKDPLNTKPTNADKNIPGATPERSLSRLFHNKKRHARNRAAAVRTCVKYWGKDYAKGGMECDEFPFASTYQGAAQKKDEPTAPADNFSVLPIPKTENGAGGTMLAQFYEKYRVIDGMHSSPNKADDAFIVVIS
ncbi:NucA/NucB deoxyribonuclease domain-containing protein [Streptomyces jumonjinensis]|uniref:NucA/NucB deoxyribonuclease domain-containing protein n=1 Tax=Streptomyces jumonjinensis TaxID=1945 RepID=UPI0037895F2E